MIDSRADIKNLILKIENDFLVNSWKIDSVYVWPILRYHLFFSLLHTTEKDRLKEIKETGVQKGNAVTESFLSKIAQAFKWLCFMSALQPKKYLFFAPNHVRVNYQGKFFNRFFDSLIRVKGIEKQSYSFDYHQENKSDLEIENKAIYYSLLKYNTGFKSWNRFKRMLFPETEQRLIELEGYDVFLEFLKAMPETKEFAQKYDAPFLLRYFNGIAENVSFFEAILNKTKPEQIYIICYYMSLMHALLLAAKKQGVKVTEVQHGPMSDTHLSYTNWTNVPAEGYQFLPDEFWCWDKDSLNNMQSWADKTIKHSAFLGGNPWVDFLQKQTVTVSLPENIVLYTLQPLAFDVLFPENLLALMRQKKWIWYVRLHPRQYNQKEELIEYLRNRGVLDTVNLDEAYTLPLPLLLNHSIVHLTHFSGSAIEAAMMNRFTVILDKLGEDSFKEIIQNQKAIYLPLDNNFSQGFENILKTL